jgi:hypothetical protein
MVFDGFERKEAVMRLYELSFFARERASKSIGAKASNRTLPGLD